MTIQGGVAIRIINGFEFQFMHAFGYDGVLIDADVMQPDNPEFVAALHTAKRLQITWRELGSLMNIIVPLRSVMYEPDELLMEWRTKADFALKQQDWLLDADALATIQSCVALIDNELAMRQAKHTAQQKPMIPGFVYLLQSPTGAYKIGKTKTPNDRLRTFSVKMPFEVAYVCVIETLDMNGLERSLHLRFAEKRLNGEWFSLTDADVEYIKGLAK